MNKYWYVLVLIVLTACNAQEKEARQVLVEAQTLYDRAEYASAKVALDSLKAYFPKEVVVQKEGLTLMRQVDLKEQERNLVYCDSMLLVLEAQADSMKPLFKYEKDPEYDEVGKYIDSQQQIERNVQRSYIRSGVDELGNLYVASVYYGKSPIHHNQLRVSTPNGEYAETEAIPNDGGANFSFQDLGMTTEVVTYQNGKDNGVAQFIRVNKDKTLKAEYLGGTKFSLAISPADKKSLAKTVDLAIVLSDIERLKLEKEKAAKRKEYLQGKL